MIQVALGQRGLGMELFFFKHEIRVSCIGFRYSTSAEPWPLVRKEKLNIQLPRDPMQYTPLSETVSKTSPSRSVMASRARCQHDVRGDLNSVAATRQLRNDISP